VPEVTGLRTIRVRNGITTLDQRIPNWRADVNVLRLDLGDPTSCVLGQVGEAEEANLPLEPEGDGSWFGPLRDWLYYLDAPDAVDVDPYVGDVGRRHDWAVAHGFDSGVSDTYMALRDEWVRQLCQPLRCSECSEPFHLLGGDGGFGVFECANGHEVTESDLVLDDARLVQLSGGDPYVQHVP
jgi:hypothetical protein